MSLFLTVLGKEEMVSPECFYTKKAVAVKRWMQLNSFARLAFCKQSVTPNQC